MTGSFVEIGRVSMIADVLMVKHGTNSVLFTKISIATAMLIKTATCPISAPSNVHVVLQYLGK